MLQTIQKRYFQIVKWTLATLSALLLASFLALVMAGIAQYARAYWLATDKDFVVQAPQAQDVQMNLDTIPNAKAGAELDDDRSAIYAKTANVIAESFAKSPLWQDNLPETSRLAVTRPLEVGMTVHAFETLISNHVEETEELTSRQKTNLAQNLLAAAPDWIALKTSQKVKDPGLSSEIVVRELIEGGTEHFLTQLEKEQVKRIERNAWRFKTMDQGKSWMLLGGICLLLFMNLFFVLYVITTQERISRHFHIH